MPGVLPGVFYFIYYFCRNSSICTAMKVVKPLIITLSTILVLLIVVALITPPIAKNYIHKHSKELIGRQVNIRSLYLNIFTGYTRITGFQLMEADDLRSFVAFDTLTVDVSLFRLLANELRINKIHLINPDLRILQNGSEFNFDDLLTQGSSPDPVAVSDTLAVDVSDSASGLMPTGEIVSDSLSVDSETKENMVIAIYDISIQGGHIFYEDQLRHSVWEMDNFGLQIPGVYFSGKNTDVGIALNFNDGGHLQTAIQYNMEAGNYLLDIDLTNFSISPVRPYLIDFLNINAIDGFLTAHLNIEGNASHVTDLAIRGTIGLSGLSLTGAQNTSVFSTDSILIDMDNINPGKSVFHFNTIAVNGIRTAFDLRKDGNTITDLLKDLPADTTTVPVSAVAEANTALADNEPVPDFKVEVCRINHAAFTFNDYTLHTPFVFAFEDINLTADRLSLDGKNKIKISNVLRNGGNITLAYEGKLDDIGNTDLLLAIKNLDLKLFTPYSLQYFGYPLRKGILSFSSVNNIRNNNLEGRNNLNIARCEVDNKQKNPKPEFNIPLKTALYLIKDKNDLIKMDLPVRGNIDSPEFSYRKIIFKTLTNLLVKVAVSPVSFLANSLGLSPDALKNLPFEATQSDFTPEQFAQINQFAEMIKMKPEMTLVLEQFVNLPQSKLGLARFYVKRNYYLQQNPEKTISSLLPIDYSKIMEIDLRTPECQQYIIGHLAEEMKMATPDEQILSLADAEELTRLTDLLTERRNQVLKNYLIRQGVTEKNIRISTASEEKLTAYRGKNQYTVDLIFEGDEPDPALLEEQNEDFSQTTEV